MNEAKCVVVTGASSGIGAAVADMLGASGYKVVVTSRDEKKLHELYDGNDRAIIIPWDLSDADNVGEYAKQVKERVGSISGLVHCAGIDKRMPIHMIKAGKIEEVFNINTFASLLLVSAFSKREMAADGASFVLISSLAAHEGVMGNSVYAASKAAIEGFVKSVAAELADRGIRINCLAPGVTETPMVAEYLKLLTEEQRKAHVSDYPLGIGQPSDIAYFAEYLISEKARWLTGQTFILDGGHLARK